MPCCRSLIPGMVNPHGLTNEERSRLDAVDLQERRMVHGEMDQRHWWKEGQHHGRGRRGRRALIAGSVPVVLAEIASDWPLDDRIDEEAHAGAHGQRGHPFRVLQPSRADGSRMLEPAQARLHRDMLCLLGLEQLGICTHLWP